MSLFAFALIHAGLLVLCAALLVLGYRAFHRFMTTGRLF